MKPRLTGRCSTGSRGAAAAAAVALLLAGCADNAPRRGRAHGKVTGFKMTQDREGEVEVSIFNPHHDRAEIECQVRAGRSGVSIFLTVAGESRKVVTSKLHGLEGRVRKRDVTVECWRGIEE